MKAYIRQKGKGKVWKTKSVDEVTPFIKLSENAFNQ